MFCKYMAFPVQRNMLTPQDLTAPDSRHLKQNGCIKKCKSLFETVFSTHSTSFVAWYQTRVFVYIIIRLNPYISKTQSKISFRQL